MKKILIGYDGSPAAQKTFLLAKRHARAFKAKVHLLHCMAVKSNEQLEAIEAAEKDLETARQCFSADKIPVETHLHLMVSGMSPGEDLVQFGKKIGADEIILGVQKKSKLNKLIFGSTIQYALLKAHCPVVTIT
jgi:nucleotide-binding universal stress UspA family protein